MRIPDYILFPKPGVKDSIRKWEWIKKQLEQKKEIPISETIFAECGLCMTCRNCSKCAFPSIANRRVVDRCLHLVVPDIGESIKKIFNTLEHAYIYSPPKAVETYTKRAIKACKTMLNALKKIKE